MLLTELSMLKCHKKEKVKYFNQWFNTIFNKFPINVALDDSNTIDYYTKVLPHDIVVFVKREEKLTLVDKFATALEVYKDLLSISALEHNSWNDAKPSVKKNQASSNKPTEKDKDAFDFEGLAKSLKHLTNEVYKLKRKTNDVSGGGKPAKPFFRKTNNPPPKTS